MAPRIRIIFNLIFLLSVFSSSYGMGSLGRFVAQKFSAVNAKQKIAQAYFEQVETESNIPFTKTQSKYLYTYLNDLSVAPQDPDLIQKLRRDFGFWKIKLISDWVHHHQQPWPSVLKWVRGVYRPVLWEVHHIFHLSRGGPNAFWNIHPLERDVHRSIIHAPGAPGEILHGKGKKIISEPIKTSMKE